MSPICVPTVAALLQLCCSSVAARDKSSSVAALLQFCCSSVAALLQLCCLLCCLLCCSSVAALLPNRAATELQQSRQQSCNRTRTEDTDVRPHTLVA